MSEPDQIPPEWPCRRCEHPYSAHAPEGDCGVELATSRVPSFDMGGVCSCASFVYEPASEPEPAPEPELLDGPRMLADALGYVRLARTASSPLVEDAALAKATAYFAGASTLALAEIAVDQVTNNDRVNRWYAALHGADLPEDDQA
jgi:hypothetical protein